MDFLDQIKVISEVSLESTKQYFDYLSQNKSELATETLLEHLKKMYEAFSETEKTSKSKSSKGSNGRLVKYAIEQVAAEKSKVMTASNGSNAHVDPNTLFGIKGNETRIDETQLYRKSHEKPLGARVFNEIRDEFTDLDVSNSGRLDFEEFFEGVKTLANNCTQQDCKRAFDVFMQMQQVDLQQQHSNKDGSSKAKSDSGSESDSGSGPDVAGHAQDPANDTELLIRPFLQRIKKYAIDLNTTEDVIEYVFQKILRISEQPQT
ncbi:hypothetical protein RFI_20900, partial [Reticulomyxa filosa]